MRLEHPISIDQDSFVMFQAKGSRCFLTSPEILWNGRRLHNLHHEQRVRRRSHKLKHSTCISKSRSIADCGEDIICSIRDAGMGKIEDVVHDEENNEISLTVENMTFNFSVQDGNSSV